MSATIVSTCRLQVSLCFSTRWMLCKSSACAFVPWLGSAAINGHLSVHDQVHSQSSDGSLQSCVPRTHEGNCTLCGTLLLQALPELVLKGFGITNEQLSAVTGAKGDIFSVLSGRGGSGKSTVLTFAMACKLALSWRQHHAMPRMVGAGPTTHSACLSALQVCLERSQKRLWCAQCLPRKSTS